MMRGPKKQVKQVTSVTSTFFQYLQVNILISRNVIPNNFHFCIMGRDRGSRKPRSLSENQFLPG